MATVKARSLSRRERAKETRRRIVDAGHTLFAREGYASTTMDTIAVEAGVAVQTVYHVFHTKAELFREVLEVTSGSRDAPAATEPAWLEEVLETSDARRVLALCVEHGIDTSARVAPLIAAIHAALSTDPDLAGYWDSSCTIRRTGTARIASLLADRGELRPGLGSQRAADILYATTSHETLLAFLDVCGWSLPEVKAWYYGMLCDQLLPRDGRRRTRSTGGLSFDHLV